MDEDPTRTLLYLPHAKERMAERGITPQEVEEALNDTYMSTPGRPPGRINRFGTTAADRRLRITLLRMPM